MRLILAGHSIFGAGLACSSVCIGDLVFVADAAIHPVIGWNLTARTLVALCVVMVGNSTGRAILANTISNCSAASAISTGIAVRIWILWWVAMHARSPRVVGNSLPRARMAILSIAAAHLTFSAPHAARLSPVWKFSCITTSAYRTFAHLIGRTARAPILVGIGFMTLWACLATFLICRRP